MSTVDKALAIFRRPPRCLNCAQTICAAFDREDLVDDMADKARGHAPGGLCGALFAAITLHPERAEQIHAAFTASQGADTCSALKALAVPCPQNVARACRLIDEQ